MTYPLNTRTAQWLTYAGTLPLVIAAVEAVAGRVMLSDVLWLAGTYSNAVALLAWLGLLVHPQPWAVLLHILCFLYILILDYKLHKVALLPPWFYTLRRNATVIVVLSLSTILSQL
jgi:hypothetical protein